MLKNHQEEYQTLEWILTTSEDGFFLVVADEHIQKEIVEKYQGKQIGIYDCKQYQKGYSFQLLETWIQSMPNIQTFFIVNFQFAIQQEQDWKRLNFSRDMLAKLKKNLIFLMPSYTDDQLAKYAYDFYSFIKVRVIFDSENGKQEDWEFNSFVEEEDFCKEHWSQEEKKEKMRETYLFLQQAEEEMKQGNYKESIRLLLKAKKIRELLLGIEHLETVVVYDKLAQLYGILGVYEKAEELCKKVFQVRKDVLGENHPDTMNSQSMLNDFCKKSR